MEKNTNAAFANLNFDYCANEMFRIRNSKKKKKKKIETSLSMKKDLSEIKKIWSNTWWILGLWFQIYIVRL